jgi:hypothetical protein
VNETCNNRPDDSGTCGNKAKTVDDMYAQKHQGRPSCPHHEVIEVDTYGGYNNFTTFNLPNTVLLQAEVL